MFVFHEHSVNPKVRDLRNALTNIFCDNASMDRIGSKRPRWFVREWREYRGWTQEFLAERAEMTKSMISEIESGKKRLHDDLLGPLTFAFGIDTEDLLKNPLAPTREELLKAGEAPKKIFDAVKAAPLEKQTEILRWVTTILKDGTND